MSIELIFGIGIIAIGAFASGSFSIPFGKTRGWAWEVCWLTYCLSAYVIMPMAACAVFCPDFITILSGVSVKTLGWIFLLGAVYGICNLTFGLTLRYLGLSLGFMVSLGLMMVLGTIIPPFIDGRLSILLQQSGGTTLMIGLLVAIAGVALSAYAGYRKDNSVVNVNPELDFKKGILLALFVGVSGSSQALGIEQGNGIAATFISAGTNSLFATLPVFLVMFLGSFSVTAVWCLTLAKRNKTLLQFIKVSGTTISLNYLYCGLAGLLWFGNLIFFGMGKSCMGEFSFTAWGILMSLTIACATIWGLCRGEWKSAGQMPRFYMYTGLIILIIASFIIGISSEG
ncbi:L-rhamnose/proton symporter RhaT [Bacteroides sp.]|uniref:L-rhamnose/proton symporter RhaT n=1 Tax=Bacteroides sp. TaxID=29523 RepID=UPI0025C540DD|nr:L-rhamnose/proton symporter RhaT [Bacteroides sp.]